MGNRTYRHSAYWYAYHCGWTYSEARTYAGKYLDMHTYRPRIRERTGGILNRERTAGILNRERTDGRWDGKDWFKLRNAEKRFDSTFNPLLLCACAMVDVGVAMRERMRRFADPEERDRMKRELVRDLRALRRPFYYARETKRRRQLAEERRKIVQRTTTAPMPTPDALLAAWNARKDSREAMIRLGGLLDDLACHVDSRLRFDEAGNVVGRNAGIRGWLAECLPELSPKYKTLMRYKAMAMRLRQATGTKDPTPTSVLLDKPQCEIIKTLLADTRPAFSQLFEAVDRLVSAECVFLDAPKEIVGGKNDKPPHERFCNATRQERRKQRRRRLRRNK